jgi:hypothetical protein
MSEPRRRLWPWIVFGAIAVVGVGARLWLATLGHNYDMTCWEVASDLVVSGQNVYANTTPRQYNYGPAWFLLLGALKWFVRAIHAGHPEAFHVAVAAALSAADVTIGLLLWRRTRSLIASAFFLLNPVSALITGYHTQADTLAIAYAYGAWAVLRPQQPDADLESANVRQSSNLRVLCASALLAMSLLTKHLMVLFPIWILMSRRVIPDLRRRVMFFAATFALTVIGFVPFAFAPGAWEGIKANVLRYQSFPATNALLVRAINWVMPFEHVNAALRRVPMVNGIRGVFMAAMVGVGFVVARKRPGLMFHYYLLALVTLTSAMADQYLAIPIAACAVFWRCWPAWIYTVAAAWVLMYSPVDVGRYVFHWWYGPRLGTKMFREMATLPVPYHRATVWLLILLTWDLWAMLWRGGLRQRGRRATAEASPPESSSPPPVPPGR